MVVLILCAESASASTTDAVNGKRISVFGEYLHWYASEQTDGVWANDIGFPATNHVTYATPNVQFDWSNGFKSGISFAAPNFWDITLLWTHLPASKSMAYSADAFHLLTPEFFSGYLSGDSFSSAHAKWKILMNTVDLTISHAIHVDKSLVFRPMIGVKQATMNQTIDTEWNATLFSIPLYTSTEVVTNHFSGIGPELGINGLWNFYQGFSITGDVSTALMWGHWNVKDTYSKPSTTTITTKMNDAKLGTPVYQGFFGLQWMHESSYQINIKLGYEMQYWADQLRAPTFQLLPLHGDLTLQGVTCGISLSF